MFSAREWEMFYTESLWDTDLVDQISIDLRHRKYMLETDVNDLVTDGFDEEGEPVCSTFVSRFIFDLIVSGVKKKGLVEFVGEL